MNFSLKNYSCEWFNLTGTVGKVELISTFTTVVCDSWNVSDKYTWDNTGDLKQLNYSWTKLSVRIIGAIKRQFFHMVTHVFDNSNLSQEFFAMDTCGAVICSLGHGRKHMLTILPTIWRPGFTTAVCESWNVSVKYTWDNAGDLKQLSIDQAFS